MTDDLTRGLAMLADEAMPAQIDSHDVITRARARTRNQRATAAAAVATFAVVTALVTTVGGNTAPDKPATTNTVTPTARTQSELLDNQLTSALPKVIPSDWHLVRESSAADPAFAFMCGLAVVGPNVPTGSTGCVAHATYRDRDSQFDIQWHVDDVTRGLTDRCDPQYCTEWGAQVRQNLPDGTRTQLFTYSEKSTPLDIQKLDASRPDGTQLTVAVIWSRGERSKPALTTNEIMKWATVFAYVATLPPGQLPGMTTTTPFKTDDPARPTRLTAKLNDVLAEVIPSSWTETREGEEADEPRLTFVCTRLNWGPNGHGENPPAASEGCETYGVYKDGIGETELTFLVTKEPAAYNSFFCDKSDCVEKKLKDGTMTRVRTTTEPDPAGEYHHDLVAKRPNGTYIVVDVFWKEKRATTPITDEQLLKFATAFTF